jgi:hypothetical protein
MKQSNTQTVIHNSNLYQRYTRSSIKHNHIFSLSQLHISTMYSHHQASHKRENKYTDTFGIEVSMLYINCVTFLCVVDCASRYNCVKKTNLMHILFLLYFGNLYMFRAYLGPSSGGTTICIQQLVPVPIQPGQQTVI